MPDKKISALTPVSTPISGEEVLPIVQNSETKQITASQLTEAKPVLGVNGAPKNWTIPAIQLTNAAIYSIGDETGYYVNAYYENGWKYISNGISTGYIQNGGIHQWYGATSGVANDPISFTQIANLNSSNGNLTLNLGNFVVNSFGKGITLTSPNGLITKTLTIDNAGLITLI